MRERLAKESHTAYTAAMTAATALPHAHPLRLGLALNFSVFNYEIMEQPEEVRETTTHLYCV